MRDNRNHAADYFSELFNGKYENASNVAKRVYGNLVWKGDRIKNVDAKFGRGNLFEYIESAKLQVNQAKKGVRVTETLTDLPKDRGGYGSHTDSADFRFKDGTAYQAKIGDKNYQHAMVHEKYKNMYKISTTDVYDNYMNQLEEALESGEITRKEYMDLKHYAQRSLTDPGSGVSSEGTSTQELEQFRGKDGKIDLEAVKRYSNYKINKQLIGECAHTIGAATLANAIFSCIGSTVTNVRKYNKNEISKQECVENIAKDSAKGAGHGFAVGTLASGFRIVGFKNDIPILRNGCSSLIIANGVIDIGKSLYYFKKGELSFGDFIGSVAFDTVKTVGNVMISTALAFNPFLCVASSIAFELVANSIRKLMRSPNVEREIVYFTKELLDCFNRETNKIIAQLEMEVKHHKEMQREFIQAYNSCFSLSDNEFDSRINALYRSLGSSKMAQGFNEFDCFMNSKEKIRY